MHSSSRLEQDIVEIKLKLFKSLAFLLDQVTLFCQPASRFAAAGQQSPEVKAVAHSS